MWQMHAIALHLYPRSSWCLPISVRRSRSTTGRGVAAHLARKPPGEVPDDRPDPEVVAMICAACVCA